MEIGNTTSVVAVQSVESTSAATTSSAQVGASSSSPYSSRLLSRITSSSALTGIEKNGLIETVSLIDNLKSGDTLRSKLLKDVAAVTTYLEKTAGSRGVVSKPVKVQQKISVVDIAERINKQIIQEKPTQEALKTSVVDKLESVVQESRNVSAEQAIASVAGAEEVVEVALPGSGAPIENVSSAGEVVQAEINLPGSGAQELEVVVDGVGESQEQHLVEIQIPGSGEAELPTAENAEGSDIATAQVLDKLV